MRINLFGDDGVGRGNKAILKWMGLEILQSLYPRDISELLGVCRESDIVLCAEVIPAGRSGCGTESNDVVFMFYKPWKGELAPLKPDEYPLLLPDRVTVEMYREKNGEYIRKYDVKQKEVF